MTHAWKYMGSPTENPMGVEIFGMVAGLGFVLSFGYWCTNFLVVQRAMAAESMSAARRTPLIGTIPKMFLPFIVIMPGIAARGRSSKMNLGYALPLKATGGPDYDQVLTTLMAQFYPAGMLGVGMTGLMASFMSGMAGNVTAFNTVFTYDIYQSYIRNGAPDRHYLTVGRVTTVVGVLLSIAAAYVATRYNNIMDLLQLVFGCVNAPLFATFLLGMFWKRATAHGAFTGLTSGTAAAFLTLSDRGGRQRRLDRPATYSSPPQMAQNFWIAIIAFTTCFIISVVVSLVTTPRPDKEMEGLVYGLTKVPHDVTAKWYQRPAPLAVAVVIMLVILNIWFSDDMDLRVPSGWFFSLLGLILLGMGIFAPETRAALTNANVNLYAGACMLVFGLFLLLLAWRASEEQSDDRRIPAALRIRGWHPYLPCPGPRQSHWRAYRLQSGICAAGRSADGHFRSHRPVARWKAAHLFRRPPGIRGVAGSPRSARCAPAANGPIIPSAWRRS